ncbi:hypothetical protein Poly30_32510 [Planctomycetes bacterium Poly30]|uniref:Uncharacterized protein n=1 Tax=Saltatorellus ferox TaxID=2528018 RepID=A0A518EUH8_9BACT|nr:hypothetical protein Poly30_32510 [Planctomycetes bacterium Poly30]
MLSIQRISPLALLLALSGTAAAAPQRAHATVTRSGPSPSSTERAAPAEPSEPWLGATDAVEARRGARPVILLTGYWPPTNESVRRFSQNPTKNPGGWVGSDWMGRGYDVVSYFPEFNNPNCSNCGKGFGDLEVDYQDTTADFARITDIHRPIAIITFSRGGAFREWEVESNQFNYSFWIDDFVAPRQPTPAPPDSTVASHATRLSALPMQEIVDDIDASGLGLNAFICYTQGGGGYLSEFIAYQGVWYQARHADPSQPDWCIAAGHIHVGAQIGWADASSAVDVSLTSLVDYLDQVRACPPIQPYCEGLANSVGTGAQLSAVGSPSLAENELRLLVQRVPDFAAGLVFYGPQTAMGTIGNGQLCVGGALTRLPIPVTANNLGVMRFPIDVTAAPLGIGPMAVTPGSSWHFQAWYRDSGAGAGSNTTNALSITFCP